MICEKLFANRLVDITLMYTHCRLDYRAKHEKRIVLGINCMRTHNNHMLLCVQFPVKLKKQLAKHNIRVQWRLHNFEDQDIAQAFWDIVSGEAVGITQQMDAIQVNCRNIAAN